MRIRLYEGQKEMIGHPDFLSAVRRLREAYPIQPQAYRLPLVAADPLGEEEIAAALEALICGPVTQGWRVKEFERVFAEAHGREAAVFCNSGSSANLLAVRGMNIERGGCCGPRDQEITVPAIGWPTTVWPICQAGGVPVFVDVDPETFGTSLHDAIQTRGDHVLPAVGVHLLGNPTGISASAFEDCCEALDAVTPSGMKVGSRSRFATFSFYLSHHITTIEGGMVLCDAADADRLRSLHSHGWTRGRSDEAAQAAKYSDFDPRYLFISDGYNLRGTDVAAAIGLVQFAKRGPWAKRRRFVASVWTAALNQDHFQPIKWAARAVPFAFPLVCRGDYKDKLINYLEAHGVENRPLLAGNLARQPAMKNIPHRVVGDLPGANFLHDHALYVGLHPQMTQEQIDYLPEVLRGFKP